MIRVTVDLVPFGNEDRSHKIGEMVIANDGTGDSVKGNYGYAWKDNSYSSGDGAVFDFPRGDGIWELIRQCLEPGPLHNDEDFIDLVYEKIGMDNE